MEDLRALIIGIVGAFIVLALKKFYRHYQRSSLKVDIDNLEYEKSHLEEMKNSSIEMSRSAYRSIFVIFTFISFAELVPAFSVAVNGEGLRVTEFISFAVWVAVLAISIMFWKRFDNLKNFEKAISKIDDKLLKLKSKSTDEVS